MTTPLFPFTAVVGQDDVKLALLLNAVDPRIGGVLLRGHKGSAKSTLARALATLLPGEAPFVELPVGATEDRLTGTIDLDAALRGEGVRFQPGLLASAHGGVLYIDEVNLLPDHLVDALLDVAASGINRVEREGLSHAHPSRFVLAGSMNPEEGDLRPQLLDRFGLAVDVESALDPAARAEAVRRRIAFDADATTFLSQWRHDEDALRAQLASSSPAAISDEVLLAASRVCAAVGAEGLRGDLTVARAAAALAGFEGRAEAEEEDVRRVARLALAHRRRRSPFEEPGVDQEEIDDALDEPPPDAGNEAPSSPEQERVADADSPRRVVALGIERISRGATPGRRSTMEGTRGRLVGDRAPSGPTSSVAVGATIRAAALRTADEGGPVRVAPADLREAVRVERAGNLIVLAVDASGSMGAERRMEAVKGAVLSLLLDAYQRRDKVALVTFREETANVVLRPTGSVEVARARLADVPTGGRTPLGVGIDAALGIAAKAGPQSPLLVLLSDGRATAAPEGSDPLQAALAAAGRVRAKGIRGVVIDAEEGPSRLGLASQIATAMGARYLPLPALSAGALTTVLNEELT